MHAVIVYEDGDENEVELEEYDTINGEDHKGNNYDFWLQLHLYNNSQEIKL